MFPMIFQSSMGLENQGVIVPSGTIQKNSYLLMFDDNGFESFNSLRFLIS
jgi:hypothetical protein